MKETSGLNFNYEHVSDEESTMKASEENKIAYEVAKFEYEHSLKRNEKLDQKICIVLAVYAFLANMLSDTLADTNVDLAVHCIISILFYNAIILVGLYFLWQLKKIIELLKSKDTNRFDTDYLVESMLDYEKDKIAKDMCKYYAECVSNNDKLLDSKNEEFNWQVRHTVYLACAIMLMRLGTNILISCGIFKAAQ